MAQVAMQQTSETQQALADALSDELRSLPDATASTGAIMLSQINIETTSGKNIWNHNVGNITTTGKTGDWWSPSKGDASGLKFAVYPSLADGMRGYVGFIKSRPKMLAAANSGDLGEFSNRIKADGYNPEADPVATAKTLLPMAEKALPLFVGLPTGPQLRNSLADVSASEQPSASEQSKPSRLGLVVGSVLILGGAVAAAFFLKGMVKPNG